MAEKRKLQLVEEFELAGTDLEDDTIQYPEAGLEKENEILVVKSSNYNFKQIIPNENYAKQFQQLVLRILPRNKRQVYWYFEKELQTMTDVGKDENWKVVGYISISVDDDERNVLQIDHFSFDINSIKLEKISKFFSIVEQELILRNENNRSAMFIVFFNEKFFDIGTKIGFECTGHTPNDYFAFKKRLIAYEAFMSMDEDTIEEYNSNEERFKSLDKRNRDVKKRLIEKRNKEVNEFIRQTAQQLQSEAESNQEMYEENIPNMQVVHGISEYATSETINSTFNQLYDICAGELGFSVSEFMKLFTAIQTKDPDYQAQIIYLQDLQDHRIASYAIYSLTFHRATETTRLYINLLCSHSEYRGQGYAKFLLKFLQKCALAYKKGEAQIVLIQLSPVLARVHYYESLGFVALDNFYHRMSSSNLLNKRLQLS